MAVPEQIPVVNYVADGIVKKFDVPFEYDQQSDLHVYVDGAEPTIDKYYFDGNAFNFYIAPTVGQDVKIKRITPKERDTDYNLHTNTVRPKALNTDFDRLWYVLQEVFSDVGGLSQAVQDEIIARIQGDEDLLNQLTAEISARMLGDEAVTDDLKNYINNMIALIIGDPSFNGIDANKVNDASGLSQQQINDLTSEKTLNLLDFFTISELSAYKADYMSVDILEAWDRAAFSANYLNQSISAFGKFRSASTLTLTCAANLSNMILESSATSIAIDCKQPDNTSISFKEIILPQVINLNKVAGDNWVSTTAIGVRVVNLNRCFVTVTRVQGFAIGFHEWATNGRGNGYNTYHLGQLNNNKINLLISADNTVVNGSAAWVNQNKHEGGSFSHFTNEGSNIPDCHHLKITASQLTSNSNTFNEPSFENYACDFHIVNGGRYNSIVRARWEVTGGFKPKVKYYCDSGLSTVANHGTRNEIIGGYEVELIEYTKEGVGSQFINATYTQNNSLISMVSGSGGHKYRNSFGADAGVITVFSSNIPVESATLSQYSATLSANTLKGKRTADTADRVQIDFQNGLIKLGDGTGNYSQISSSATSVRIDKRLLPTVTDTVDLGVSTFRFKDVHLSGAVGFFSTVPPSSKPSIAGKITPTTIAEQNAVLSSIVSALVSYGLVSDDRT